MIDFYGITAWEPGEGCVRIGCDSPAVISILAYAFKGHGGHHHSTRVTGDACGHCAESLTEEILATLSKTVGRVAL